MNYYELSLGRGLTLLVDIADEPLWGSYRWYAYRGARDTTFYARTNIDGNTLLLHRLLVGATPTQLVDHRNRNGLDDRRSNLRLCTPAQNASNRPPPKNNTSGYKGVVWLPSSRKWRATIGGNGQPRKSLGLFTDPWEAAQAYNRAALEQWGEFARLNERQLVTPGHRPK